MTVRLAHLRTFPARTVGALWRVEVAALDDDGYHAGAAALVAKLTTPNGTTTELAAAAVTQLPDERWRVEAVLTNTGRHVLAIESADDIATASTYVGATTALVPSVADVQDYLGDTSSWGDDAVGDALAAEQDDQLARCVVPAVYPPALRHALFRRVQRNLALRNMPLGLTSPDDDGARERIPGWDAEIRRFEAPHRKLVVA
ncbi:MAG TPA: hypothetical protein VD903_11940 [Pseudonocardia sp.]|nr:hypothetical protein [Pseudonocardia sp.]